MNIIYFTMKKLNENRAFLAMLGFLFVFSCSKDKKEGNGNGNGNGDVTKYTLTITKPTGGTLTSDAGGISCGSEDNDCKAEFEKDTEVTLTATADTGYILGAWQGACDKTKATESTCKLNMDANKTVGLTFTNDIDGDSVLNVDDVDDDNDGLMEIHDLDMFNHIQYSLAGTSYKTGADATDNREGAPEEATDDCTTIVTDTVFYLCGYELARDLDFAEGASYAGGSVNTDWRPNDQADAGGSAANPDDALNPGFVGTTNFNAVFDGNGHSISNLYSRGGGNRGLFRSTTATATIRNVGVVAARLYGGAGKDVIGGLVGYNLGDIIASYATGAANGGAGDDIVGGLVGENFGNILASYATGNVDGGDGDYDNVGGLVGYDFEGSISASYATGAVNGGAGDDNVGGLVGIVGNTNIVASYATGNVDGGDGDYDDVDTLIGEDYHGGDFKASYGFKTPTGGTVSPTHYAGNPPMGVADANALTAANAGTEWDDAGEKTKGAWDFGTNMQAPALRYADYDGAGGVDYCAMFPVGTICGSTLLPGQRP